MYSHKEFFSLVKHVGHKSLIKGFVFPLLKDLDCELLVFLLVIITKQLKVLHYSAMALIYFRVMMNVVVHMRLPQLIKDYFLDLLEIFPR